MDQSAKGGGCSLQWFYGGMQKMKVPSAENPDPSMAQSIILHAWHVAHAADILLN